MPFYIKDKEQGLFVGECMGLGFYEASIEDGELSPEERPVPFETYKEAQEYLNSWSGGIPEGTEIIYMEDESNA